MLIVVEPHAVVLVAFCFNTPALQFPPTLLVWLHCVTAVQPVPLLRVHPDVWSGHGLQFVAVPPADHTAPLHWVHVCPFTYEPAFACNATDIVAAVGHALALVAFFFN